MKTPFFFAVGTIGLSCRGGRKGSTLEHAARHNLREIQRERGGRSHIDGARTVLNQVIAGPNTARAVADAARAEAARAGVDVDKLRKDYCQAIELLFSLPADTTIDTGAYFKRCVDWARERFGVDAVLSAVAHHDEAAPHAHVLMSPVVDGRMKGSALVGRTALAELRRSFELSVARPFGLKQPPGRLQGVARGQAVRAVLERLEQAQDVAMRSALWQTIRQAIEADPRPFMLALGLKLAQPAPKRRRTMTQIFTSPGRGPRAEREAAAPTKPIGFESLEETETYPV